MYKDLFKTFLRIGAFTIGGGYAMIPIIEADVVEKHRWLDKEMFIDLVAVAQACPGVFAINLSIFVGRKVGGFPGALMATFGTVLPSLLIILLIAMCLTQFLDIPWVAAAFNGIRPAVVALIASPCFTMAKQAKITLLNAWIPIVCALAIWALGVNPIYVLLAAGVLGFIYGVFISDESTVKPRF
ncbi:MAG: chromate transporter [Prevotella sp.]|nr:chromate transporter [Prevotella sp.]